MKPWSTALLVRRNSSLPDKWIEVLLVSGLVLEIAYRNLNEVITYEAALFALMLPRSFVINPTEGKIRLLFIPNRLFWKRPIRLRGPKKAARIVRFTGEYDTEIT